MRWLVLVLLCSCRFGWSGLPGARPPADEPVKLALYAKDAAAETIARAALPNIAIVSFDAKLIDAQRTECGSETCPAALTAACTWSAQHGADYYAIVSVSTTPESKQVDGQAIDSSTVAMYTLDVYAVKQCVAIRSLSRKLSTRGYGPQEQSRPQALASLATGAAAQPVSPSNLITIGVDGRVSRHARDGYYAVIDDDKYRGHVELRAAATDAEDVRPLYCCGRPTGGERLVPRGPRRFLDIAVNVAMASVGGHVLPGAGVHARYYEADGGLQLGFGADTFIIRLSLLTPEVGWGFVVAPGFVVSANLGVGWATSTRDGAGENGTSARASARHVMGNVRLQTFFSRSIHATVDVGYVYVDRFEDYGSGAGSWQEQTPIARFGFGVDL